MKITLLRKKYSDRSTIGQLSVDGKVICDTLEDVTRAPGVKVFGKTAIPAGAYRIIITHSPRFGRDLPLLLNVPGFDAIRIHSGNDDADTEGCILVGDADTGHPDWISNSRAEFAKLFPSIEAGVKTPEGVILTVEDSAEAAPTKQVKK